MLLDLRSLWEAISGIIAKAGSDTGAGTDSATVLAALTPTGDIATGADASTVLAQAAGADAGGGTDAGSLLGVLTGAEAPTASDTSALSASIPGSDVVLGGDGAGVLAALSVADASVSSEAVTVDTAVVLVSLTVGDVAIATDAALLADVTPVAPPIWGGAPTARGKPIEQKRRAARLGEQAANADDVAFIAAALSAGEHAQAGDFGMIRKYPGPAMINSVVLAAIAALDQAA